MALGQSAACADCGREIRGAAGIVCLRCTLELACTIADETDSGPPRPAAPLAGFGQYELLELLGHGGMGSVWTARDTTLNRIVALKRMHPWVRPGDTDRKQLLSEARAAARLQHAGIVRIHEVGEHDGCSFLAMEYVDGSNLADLIAAGPLAADRAARCLRSVAEAMHYAHERGVLHRDLKPHNILVDRDDQPLVSDFGLATLDDLASPTMSAAVVGTPSFMPPEQASGRRDEMDCRSDVYSLGATLYACLTGRPPFFADTPVETLRQVLDADPAPPRILNRHVPRDLERICLKCLSKDPRQRYATMRELADDLGRFLRHEPIAARSSGRLRRSWLLIRRYPVPSTLLGVSALLVAMLAFSAFLFRGDVLDSNVQSAQLAAGIVRAELENLEADVEGWALDPALERALQRGDASEQQAILRQAFERHSRGALGPLRVRSWLLLGASGLALANWPPRERRLNDRSFRDYYLGPMRFAQVGRADKADRVYLSPVFRSLIDDYYNFAISRVVRGTDGVVAGILVGLVGPSSTDDLPSLSTQDRKTVLASRCDVPAPSQLGQRATPAHVIMLHPAYRGRSEAVAIEHPNVTALLAGRTDPRFERDAHYSDPVSSTDRLYAGKWLAGFARVAGTPFVVIFQTRDWVGDALRLGGLIVCGTLLAGLVRHVARRRAGRRS